jgi:hypothetical protein
MGRKVYETFTCSCGVRCRMVPNSTTGKLAPITLDTHDNGNVVLMTPEGYPASDNGAGYAYRVLGKPQDRAANAGQLFLNHWSNCPDADKFRR